MRPPPPDLLRIVEAAYELDLPELDWLRGLLDAMRPSLDGGLGVAAYVYDASARPLAIRSPILDCPVDLGVLREAIARSSEDYVAGSWLSATVGTASETPGFFQHPSLGPLFGPGGIRDVFVVNALDSVGVGCWLGAPLPDVRVLDAEERSAWTRVAEHVGKALRLRLRLASEEPPDSTPRSSRGARAALRAAIRQIDRAPAEDEPALRAARSWSALARAKVTLLDQFDTGGKRYIVARTVPQQPSEAELLTERERQVVEHVMHGHTYKAIAFTLGLSPSTVRVLVARAATRLGAKTREELVARVRKLTARGRAPTGKRRAAKKKR